jgi:hypothetical protein
MPVMVTAAAWGVEVTAAAVTITGIDAPTPVHVSGGSHAINGGAFTSGPGVLRPGDRLSVRASAAIEAGAVAEALVEVGGVSSVLRITTTTQPLLANKRVGGSQPTHPSLAAAVASLRPGDVLDIAAGSHAAVVFSTAGRPDAPIIVRGVADAQGRRPVIQGAISNTTVLLDGADHLVLDNLEVTNGGASTGACVRNVAHRVTLQRVKVHGCANHGILGADDGGSLTLDRVEVSTSGCSPSRGMACDGGNEKHPVYVATHPRLHPHATLRIIDSVFRDNRAGETIKGRAQRVEIRGNRIESSGNGFRALGLYGYDGETASLDDPIHHDIVGNLLIARDQAVSVARFGGDGTGNTHGRTRFVGNTVLVDARVASTRPLIQLSFVLEAFIAHNNIFSVVAGSDPRAPVPALNTLVLETSNLQWADARKPKLLMTHNHAPQASTLLRLEGGASHGYDNLPAAGSGRVLQDWVRADTPGFVADLNFEQGDWRLRADSPLLGRGTALTRREGWRVPAAWPLPTHNPASAAPGGVPSRGAARADADSLTPALGALN